MKTTAVRQTLHKPKGDNPLVVLKRILKSDEAELAYLFETNPRTIYRWTMDGPPDYYEPLVKWLQLVETARKVLKDEAIGEWFHEPNRALEGSVPIRLAADPRGFKVVESLLTNAAFGNPL